MFLPTTKEEFKKLGWKNLDVILISGDVYIDSPYDGSAVIGHYLAKHGYKVGIISQPDIKSPDDISRLGEPNLFWGISAGCVDSMVANYTALKKPRRSDDLTPGNINNRRPDRAVIVYTNLIKQYFKNSAPIIIGGIESSLRRIAHYDYWSDSIRRSILFDSKADLLVYGMGETTILEIAKRIQAHTELNLIRGTCIISHDSVPDYISLPTFEEVKNDKIKFIEMFHEFYKNNDFLNAKGLVQKTGNRYLIQNPPAEYLSTQELDKIYEMDFEYDVHPYYKVQGIVKATETTEFSITSHRGCFGECNFCSITVHQGRKIISRSEESILKEAEGYTKLKNFKGHIKDVGGATSDMFKMECPVQNKNGSCKNKRCAFPETCPNMNIDHVHYINLLDKIRSIKGIKKVFIGSGLRYDLIMNDKISGHKLLKHLVKYHTSGQMKIAPEHIEDSVLRLMGKPKAKNLLNFTKSFYKITEEEKLKQFLTYYFIAAHPGCNIKQMNTLKEFCHDALKTNPEQIQIFTPTPSTYSSLMYYTGLNPFTLEPIFIERDFNGKSKQKSIIVSPQTNLRHLHKK